jgi:hypothetical protein
MILFLIFTLGLLLGPDHNLKTCSTILHFLTSKSHNFSIIKTHTILFFLKHLRPESVSRADWPGTLYQHHIQTAKTIHICARSQVIHHSNMPFSTWTLHVTRALLPQNTKVFDVNKQSNDCWYQWTEQSGMNVLVLLRSQRRRTWRQHGAKKKKVIFIISVVVN